MRSRAVGLTWMLLALGATPAGAASTGTIAFITKPKPKAAPSLFLIATAAGTPHRVSRPAERVEAFAWSPGGGSLAYSAAAARGRSSVIVERANGSRPRVISQACAVPCPLAWSPDGTSLAFPGAAGKVLVVRISNGRARTVARIPGRTATALAWSPDGRMLALRVPLARSSGGGTLDLVTLGAGRVALVPGGVTAGPAWSPDGTMLLFAARSPAGTSIDSLAVGTAGAVPRVLAPGSSAAFSPDGGRIAYAGGSGLSLMNDDGSAQVLVRAGRISAPAWSADGMQLVYSRSGVLSVGDLIGSADVSTGERSTAQAAWRPAPLLAHDPVPGYGSPDFQATSALGAPSLFALDAAGDFNGDGLQDVVIARQALSPTDPVGTTGTPMPLGVLENDGRGHLADAGATVFGGAAPSIIQPKTLDVADFNEDGLPDIFVGSDGFTYPEGLGRNRLFLSTGDGHEVDATANLPLDQNFAWTTSIADVNGDGHLDLFVDYPFSNGSPPPEIWLGDGHGRFALDIAALPAIFGPAGQSYAASAFADVNGDGAPDLVLGAFGPTGNSIVLLNDRSGHLTSELSLPAKAIAPDAQATAIQPLDLDRDGHVDLLVAYSQMNNVATPQGRWLQVLIGNGNGTFRDETATRYPQTPNTLSTFFGSMQVLDIDGDGILDVGAHMIGSDPLQGRFFADRNGALQDLALPGFANGGLSEWQAIDLDGTGGHDLFQSYADPQLGRTTEQHLVYLQTGNPLPPGPPSTLRAQSTTTGAVRLSWAYSWGAVAYQVWRSVAGAPPRWIGTAHATRYDDATAPPETSVTYSVRAVNASGTSIASPAATITRA
jgi:Tol biopolymer transport system component